MKAETVNALQSKFVPVVKKSLARVLNECNTLNDTKVSVTYQVRFVETMPQVNGIMCHMVLKIAGSPTIDELGSICAALDVFTRCEDKPIEFEGYSWHLGDGDDQLAVWYNNGELLIWLRGWKS